METAQPATVDEYIAAQDLDLQNALYELRAIIRDAAPQAEERIAYGVPAYRLHYVLVSFGVTKNACSFYTQSPGLVEKMKEELRGQKLSGATLHFEPGSPLPEELIRKIVLARIRENEQRTTKKDR